jgi:hypothetical protein
VSDNGTCLCRIATDDFVGQVWENGRCDILAPDIEEVENLWNGIYQSQNTQCARGIPVVAVLLLEDPAMVPLEGI